MSNNNPQRISPRFSSSTSHTPNDTVRSSPAGKRNKIYSQDPNFLPQGNLNSLDPNILQFYLQKLDLLYQNLEGRVLKLEQLFSTEINNGNNFSTMIPTIDNNIDVGHFEFNSAIIAPSICSNSSSSTHGSILEPNHKEFNVIIQYNELIILVLI